MKTVYINKFNILDYFQELKPEERKAIEISDEEAEKIKVMPYNKLWKGDEEANTFNLVINTNPALLRISRSQECFPYINRSNLGFNSLTKEQQKELKIGYQAGLDVTETLEIPKKPDGLN